MKTPERQYDLNIKVTIRDTSPGGGYLEIEESIEIPASSFIEMAVILGKFHELAQKIDSETKERG